MPRITVAAGAVDLSLVEVNEDYDNLGTAAMKPKSLAGG
jgi:hypothetical protein